MSTVSTPFDGPWNLGTPTYLSRTLLPLGAGVGSPTPNPCASRVSSRRHCPPAFVSRGKVVG